jgi:hypothetical protein
MLNGYEFSDAATMPERKVIDHTRWTTTHLLVFSWVLLELLKMCTTMI